MQELKKYRKNVAIVVLHQDYPNTCDILIAKRIGDNANSWQFPQGGVDENESEEAAALRELKEEIGTNDVEILSSHPDWLSYDFPSKMVYKDDGKMKGYVGQTQKYFLVKLKKGASIDINTPHPEFCEYKFVPANKVLSKTSFTKREIYSKVIKYFKEQGYF